MSSGTPLRDRLHSNSPSDPNHEWPSPATTPLRIAKRDSPQRGVQLARRQSSSYSHLKKNNLVSKSPFRSQIPTPLRPAIVPSPRRVSGEKRSRPASMHEQAENEHPLGFKRRQSKGFQGLLEKEPVTKSPFKLAPGDEGYEEPPPPPPITPSRKLRKKAPVYEEKDELPPPPPPKHALSPRSSPRPSSHAASPARPSLVSKRLHGPRESGIFGRKGRRKTVTFDERCDVMEFSREEELDDNAFDWVTDTDDEDDATADEPQRPEDNDVNESFDSVQVGDDSITGLVNSMLQDNEPHTPIHQQTFPDDLDHEDGIPYGRTHHADRAAAAHSHQHHEDSEPETNLVHISHHNLSTPPHSRDATPVGGLSPGSHIPLGRSTHSERQRAHKEEESAGADEDIQMLPPPSPAKRTGILPIVHPNRDSLIPRLDLGAPKEDTSEISNPTAESVDPFNISSVKDEPQPAELSFMSAQLIEQPEEPVLDPANLSVGHSEVSLSGLTIDVKSTEYSGSHVSMEDHHNPRATSTPPTSPPSRASLGHLRNAGSTQSLDNLLDLDSPPPSGLYGSLRSGSLRAGSPSLGASPRSGSPLPGRSASSLYGGLGKSVSQTSLHSPDNSISGRSPRISREDVHRRLLKKRSTESPLRDVVDFNREVTTGRHTPDDEPEQRRSVVSRSLPRPLARDNPTYDGIMSIDPEPQSTDPPRPSLAPRANSADNIIPQAAAREHFAGLNLDFSTGFDVGMDTGLGMSLGETPLGDMRSALDRLMEDVAGEASVTEQGVVGLKVEAVTAGIQAGQYQLPPEASDADAQERSREVSIHDDTEMADGISDAVASATPDPPRSPGNFPPASRDPVPPQPPAKDAIRAREELIKRKKREARKREEDEDLGLRTPPRNIGLGRPSRRRSKSTSDAENVSRRTGGTKSRPSSSNSPGGLLDDIPVEDEEDPLADSIDRELRKLGTPNQRGKYHVRERSETIYASSDADKVTHMDTAGDVNSGKAWRAVRRPSDMNEYSKQIKALRAQGGKAHGKVFVKVLGVKNLIVPLPEQPTAVSCTLNNGIHFVTTPESRLEPECRIEQEFELIETSKLEITLTLKIRRDPHIIAQFKANAPPPPAPPPPVAHHPPPPASKGGGMRSFFLGSPKKPHKISPPPRATPPPPPPIHRLHENLARYLTPDGSLARAFVQFKDIARHCDTRLFETTFPLIGQKLEVGGSTKSMQVGELVLQVFRLPPLPGIPPDQLPQSLEECHRGLRHINWHKLTYFEGTLTQSGGDCVSWRRRHLRIIGSNLVAFNDVTKKATATIDLRKAIGVEDDEMSRNTLLSPASGVTSRYSDEYACPYGVERSFRLLFPNNDEIMFFADSDDEKARWLEVLRALVGHIPPKPLWAEVVWLRQEELAKQAGSVASRTNGS